MNLAARNLLQDKRRVALSVASVALALMLILILTGFVSGINLQLSRYLDHAPGSLVLVQSGSQGNSSVLPAATVATVRQVAGVASAVPVISQYAVLDLGQSKQFAVVMDTTPCRVVVPGRCARASCLALRTRSSSTPSWRIARACVYALSHDRRQALRARPRWRVQLLRGEL